MICLRQRRYRELVDTALAGGRGVGRWPTCRRTSAAPDEWKVFWTFNSDRGADLGSIWLVVQQARRHDRRSPSPHTINTWSWLFFGAVVRSRSRCSACARPATPRLAQLGFLVVAGFLLVNKVYSPQYVLWLLPLAVLARPRWRDQLIWQAGEVLYFASVWWYLGGYLAPGGGGDAGFYWVAILLRMAAELYLVAIVVRDVLLPALRPGPADRGSRPASADVDAVERRRGVAHPDVDLVADLGHRGRRAGRNSIEACMCGGSAKSRCLPSIENGERTKPGRVQAAAGEGRGARPCRPASPVRRLEADAVGGAAADDQQVPGLRGACGRGSRTRRRARPRARRARWR